MGTTAGTAAEPRRAHEDHVDSRFGPQAASYVASAVHAAGADLDALAALLQAERPARLLDLGCGGGHVSFAAAPHCAAVTALDLSERMLAAVAAEAVRRALGNIACRQGVAEALPFDDGAFDAVVSRFSAHHWRDVPAGLAAARRVLRPGGLCVMIDAVAPAEPLFDTFLQTVELLRDPSHVRDYTPAEWRRFAADAGFTVERAEGFRIHLEFSSWVTRIGTSDLNVAAIRALQAGAPEEVVRRFAVEADGSFRLDTLMLVMRAC